MINQYRHNIFQIYYDPRTREENDKGFIQLDNFSNPRPDWYEYWPIRNYLLNNELEEDCYYGFFSPKFKQKTGLGSSEVYAFLDSAGQDIVVFSPFFDQSAFALNIFEQGAANHGNIYPCFIEAFKTIGWQGDIQNLVMTSRNTIFCNYFAAKKRVWQTWFEACEKIFFLCEDNKLPVANLLNSPVNHSGSESPSKVFVIERIISFLLATRQQWSVKIFNPMRLPYAASPVAMFGRELRELDALKMAYCETGFIEYIEAFQQLRSEVIEKLQG